MPVSGSRFTGLDLDAEVAAALQGLGIPAECLPMPDAESLRQGRRTGTETWASV